MTPEVWQRVKSLVADALDHPEAERAAFVGDSTDETAVRREAASILAQSADRLESCANDLATANDERRLMTGRRIGAYAILRELGRGGMGAVYLAERADGAFQKRVAIKILKRGTDTDEVLERFRSERQILARLNHPNIAGLLDAGETDDGLPYFVMEYVEGNSITAFAQQRQITLSQRLELFRTVCLAVSYAHQNLVIHRDLKPTNVLVTDDGEVKLLDFGIAKLLGRADYNATLTVHQVMTPEYASPEQVRGEPVTTVSDVYSLGVLLYELLTGQRPYKLKTRSRNDISKAICEQQPDRPSTAVAKRRENSKLELRVSKILKGDLDNIVLKALRKDPQDRYVSVDQFSADIRRYLEGLPVRARKVTAAYRASKFIRRYKFSVATAVLFIIALIAGTIATSWEAHVARVEKARAERRFDDVRKIANSLMFEFHDSIKDLPGALGARQLVTRRALEYLDKLAQETGSDVSLKNELAMAYRKIGLITFDTQQALAAHQKAVALSEATVKAEPANVAFRRQLAESYSDLSDQMKITGRSAAAIDYAERSLNLTKGLAIEAQTDDSVSMALAERYLDLGIALHDSARTGEALLNELKALDILQRIATRNPSNPEVYHQLSRFFAQLVESYDDLGDHLSALDKAQKELEVIRGAAQSEPTNSRYRRDVWSAYFHLANEKAAAGNLNEAISDYEKAAQLIESLSSADPADIGHRRWLSVTYAMGGDLFVQANRFDQALQTYRSARSIAEMLIASDPGRVESRRDLVKVYDGMALLLIRKGQNKPALDLFDKAFALAEQNTNGDPQNARVRAKMAKLCADIASLHCRLAFESNSSAAKDAHFNSAHNFFQRSIDLWGQLEIAGQVLKVDVDAPVEVRREAAQCDRAFELSGR